MTYNEIIYLVSKELDLPKELVDKTYKSYWFSIRELILKLPLKDIQTVEQFNKLLPNFNIPSIGKLYVTSDRFIGVKSRNKYKKGEVINESKKD